MLRRTALTHLAFATGLPWAFTGCGGGNANEAGGVLDESRVREAAGRLDAIVPEALKRTGVPGASVSVVWREQVLALRGYGVRRIDEAATVDGETVFQLASLSKSLAATVMATQMGDTGLDWQTPVRQLMPDFELAYPDTGDNARLSLGDLFAHRSGLPDHAGDRLEDLGWGRADILQRLRLVALDPYGSYAYTNFGLRGAAQAMARARGTTWEALSEAALYRPLGMTATSSRFDDFTARANRAWGHVPQDASLTAYGAFPARYVVQQPPRQPDAQSPAGGASASAADMARWMRLMLDPRCWQGRQVADADALRRAMTARPGGAYGYGFNVGPDPWGEPSVSHSGAFLLGAHTAFLLWPGARLGISVLTNAQPRGVAEAIALRFAEQAWGRPGDGRDWLVVMQDKMRGLYRPLGRLAGQAPPDAPVPSLPLSQYTGRYLNAYYGPVNVSLNAAGDALDLVMGPAALRHPLRHWDGALFVFDMQGENEPSGSRCAVQFAEQALTLELFSEDQERGRFARVSA